MERCPWCSPNEKMIRYHDEEWGVPVHDDQKQFEFLMMEVMQCGLNWNMMIEKREIFRECFADFDYDKWLHLMTQMFKEFRRMLKAGEKS